MKNLREILMISFFVAACTATYDPLEDYEEVSRTGVIGAPELPSSPDPTPDRELAEHGRYLVELLGCPACHTPGALVGEPDFDRWLAGSDVGVAYTNPMEYDKPGVVFPPNLTPDPRTGIGSRSDADIAAAIRDGLARHGERQILVMPWLAYSELTEGDTAAIVAYLQSIPPIEHRVPDYVSPGSSTDEMFVHFGIYRSRR